MSINRHTDKMGVGHTRLGLIGHLHSPSSPPSPVSFLAWQQTTCRGCGGGSVPQLYLHFLQIPLNLVGDSALFLSVDSQYLLLACSCFFLFFFLLGLDNVLSFLTFYLFFMYFTSRLLIPLISLFPLFPPSAPATRKTKQNLKVKPKNKQTNRKKMRGKI